MNNKEDIQISEISFKNNKSKISLLSYIDALHEYRVKIEKEIKLTGNSAIFLDTNVILRYYETSFHKRESLLQFFKRNKDKIYLTHQVQSEIIKNREQTIESFFDKQLTEFSSAFKSDILNKISHFKKQYKVLLEDFTEAEEELEAAIKNLTVTHDKLQLNVDKIKTKDKETKFSDELLELLKAVNFTSPLEEDEVKFLKAEFDEQKKGIKEKEKGEFVFQEDQVFPGCGDIKKKPENPYGDYLLYHEMLKFAKSEKRDVLFITYDSTKKDWLKSNKEPYSIYIQTTMLATGQFIYIVDADRFFDQNMKQNFDKISKFRETTGFPFDFDLYMTLRKSIANIHGLMELLNIDLDIMKGKPYDSIVEIAEEARNAGIFTDQQYNVCVEMRKLDRLLFQTPEYTHFAYTEDALKILVEDLINLMNFIVPKIKTN